MQSVYRYKKHNVLLCPMELSDSSIATYTEWANDEDILKWTGGTGTVMTESQQKELVSHMVDTSQSLHFNIRYEMENSHYLVGNCELIQVGNPIDRCYKINLYVGSKAYWNKGIGVTAMSLLINIAFKQLNANNVIATLRADNTRGFRCCRKAGFKVCGRIRNVIFYDGKYIDCLIMQVLQSDTRKEI